MDLSWLKVNNEKQKSKIDDSILALLKQAFMLGCTDGEACLFANISTDTLYRYQVKNPDYAIKKAQWKENPVLLARAEVIKGLKEKPDHALKVMKRLSKDYKQKQEVDINSDSFESILTKLKQGEGE